MYTIAEKSSRPVLLFLLVFGFSCASLNGTGQTPDNLNLPNIVLIFIDDMGYGDIGTYGCSGYHTPNLDRLAYEGMQFNSFYVSQPVCSASRASLMTGCYANRIGFSGALNPSSKIGIHPEEKTIAEILKTKKYAAAIIGKWHLGHHRMFLPLQNGFDEYLGITYSNDMWPYNYDGSRRKGDYPPELPLIRDNETIRELKNLEDQAELTTMYTEEAVDFIGRNKDRPFFLYVAHTMVHVPLAVSGKYRGKTPQGLYGDVVMEIDWSVGEVMKALEDNGLAGNTLVIFTSDNGPWLNFGNHGGSAGGLREGKRTTFEGGVRVPCLMKWPGHIPSGSICNKMASTLDILPTLADITGAELPEKKIDGVSILPLLLGAPEADPRDHFFYYNRKNNLEAVRKGSFKLILPHEYFSYKGVLPGMNGNKGQYNMKQIGYALYNLRRDPGERYDVKELYPEIVEELMELSEKARHDLGDDLTGATGANVREPGSISMEQNKAGN